MVSVSLVIEGNTHLDISEGYVTWNKPTFHRKSL